MRSVQFTYLFRGKFRHVSSNVCNAPHKTLFLKRNQGFPYGRRLDIHLSHQLAFNDQVAGLKLLREKT